MKEALNAFTQSSLSPFKAVHTVHKTEMYSAMRAEVPLHAATRNATTSRLLRQLKAAEKVLHSSTTSSLHPLSMAQDLYFFALHR